MEIVEHIQYDSDGCGDRCCQTDHGQAGIGLNTHDISKRQSNQECLDQSLCHDPYRLIISVEISDHAEQNCGDDGYCTESSQVFKGSLDDRSICGEESGKQISFEHDQQKDQASDGKADTDSGK